MIPAERLAQIPLFSSLPEDVRALISNRLKSRTFVAGEKIFSEGEPGDKLYYLVNGRVAIQKTLDAAQGTHKTVVVMGPGDFFGEMALLERGPRSASAVAATEGEALTLSTQDVTFWIDSDARLPLRLLLPFLTTLSARLRETTGEMAVLFEVSRLLVQDLSIQDLAAKLLAVMTQPFSGEIQAAFYLWSPYAAQYERAAATGGWPAGTAPERAPADPLFHWMADKGECLLSPEWEKDVRFDAAARAGWPALRSLLAAPIPAPQQPAGFVLLGHVSEKGFFTAGHRRILASVSNLVAPAFESAALREERQAEERLRRGRLGSH